MDATIAVCDASADDPGSADRRAGGAAAGSSSSNSSSADADTAPAACRICWMEADGNAGGALLSPCLCSGGLKYIHERCLQAWQRSQRTQHRGSELRQCELCHAIYSIQLVRPRPQQLQLLLTMCSVAAQVGSRTLIGEVLKKLLEPAVVLAWWQEVMATNMVHMGLKSGWEGFKTGMAWGGQHLMDARLTYLHSCIVWLACLREWGPGSIRQAWGRISHHYLPGPLQLLAQHPMHLALLLKWPQLVPALLQGSHAFALGCWASLVKQTHGLIYLALAVCGVGRQLALAVGRRSGRLAMGVVKSPGRLGRQVVRRMQRQ